MSMIKNSDCPKCKKWLAECDCEQPYPYDNGDTIDAAMSEMQEEAHQHFESIPF